MVWMELLLAFFLLAVDWVLRGLHEEFVGGKRIACCCNLQLCGCYFCRSGQSHSLAGWGNYFER
jgi:hypothetical protein